MAAFSLQLDLTIEVYRHFLANEYGDLSFFFCCFELSVYTHINPYNSTMIVVTIAC